MAQVTTNESELARGNGSMPLPTARAHGHRRNLLLAAAIPCVLLGIWIALWAPRGVFSGDSGVKLAQAHALWNSQWTSRVLEREPKLDPTGTYFPYGPEFARPVNGERQGIYSIVFVAASSPLIGVFGAAGAPVLPLIGTFLVLVAIMLSLRRHGVPLGIIGVTAAAALLLTPLLLYSWEFTAHTLGAGLVTLALYYASRSDAPTSRDMFVAGILAGSAAAVRPECYIAVAALGLGTATLPAASVPRWIRRGMAYCAGALTILVAYWLVNLVTAGTWDPAFSANQGRSSSISDSITTQLVTELKNPVLWSWLLPLSALLAVGFLPARFRRRRSSAVIAVVAAVLLVTLSWQAQSESVARTMTGLLALTPIVLFGLIRGPGYSATRVAWVFVLLYVSTVVLLEPTGAAGGLQLGARYLIPALPALLILGAVEISAVLEKQISTLTRIAVALPLLLLLALGGKAMYGDVGISKCIDIADKGASALKVVRDLKPRTVVTRRFWESRVLAAVVFEGKSLLTIQGDLGAAFVENLARSGVSTFLYVGSDVVSVPLQDGRYARTVARHAGWMTVQEVHIR